MHELIQPSDKASIPEEWDFPGKDRCYIDQIDIPTGFLSISLPANSNIDKDNTVYKGEYADYFFGLGGKPSDYLRHSTFDTYGRLRGDGLNMRFKVHEWHGPIEHAELELTFEQIFTQPQPPVDSLAHVWYTSRFHRGSPLATLASFSYGRFFHSLDPKPNAPHVLLDIEFGTEGLTTEEWKLITATFIDFDYEIVTSGDKTLVEIKKDNSVFHTLQWEVVDEVLIAKQTEMSSQITKTMEAPLAVDMSRVGEAIFQRGPYSRDENGFYDIPWMNLRNIVGARLSYEQPIKETPEEG